MHAIKNYVICSFTMCVYSMAKVKFNYCIYFNKTS